jgi:hypothetical protein
VDCEAQAKKVHYEHECNEGHKDVMLMGHGVHSPIKAATSHAAPQAVAATAPKKAIALTCVNPDIRIAIPEITPAIVPRVAAMIFHPFAPT